MQIIRTAATAAAFAVLAGCTAPNRKSSHIDPHSLIDATQAEVENRFAKAGHSATHQVVESGKSRWLLVQNFPYRGSDLVDLYIFERLEGKDDYNFCSLLLLKAPRLADIECRAQGDGIAVLRAGIPVLSLRSTRTGN